MKYARYSRLIAAGLVALLLSCQTVNAQDLASDQSANGTSVTEDTSDKTLQENGGTSVTDPSEGQTGENDDYQMDVTDEDSSSTADDVSEEIPEETEESTKSLNASSLYTLRYRVHSQTYGWLDWVSGGEIAGTTGQAKRLEAIQIQVVDKDGKPTDKVHVEYRVHVQTYGWQDWVSDGEIAGTTGQAKRLEAIQIRLTGSDGEKCTLQYKTHVQTYGWQETVTGDAVAGTSGESKRMEAVILSFDEIADPTVPVNEKASITYSGHVQTYGDVAAVADGKTLGTTGQSKRIEGITINLIQSSTGNISGNIAYCAHVQTYGWLDEVTNGSYCGTTGQSKRLEAVKIRLTGTLAEQYDIYYRTHVQTYGWLGWTKNGEPAGTEGYAKRMEAIEIRLVAKGEDAPAVSSDSFIKASEPEKEPEETPGDKTDLDQKVEQIKTYVTVPYVWGGVNTNGWDCSGCVQWIYKNIFGVTVPRLTYDQAKVGTAVSLNDQNKWQIGDLLCFAGSGVVSHTAIYIGNGQMIHALNEEYGTEIRGVWEYDAWDTGLTLVSVKRVM